MKRCSKCKEAKSITEFYCYKSGKNKGYYYSYCKKCNLIYWREKYIKKNPWITTYRNVSKRCKKGEAYFEKGRKNYLTKENLKFLWFRDKAWLLKRPSIDRKNNDDNYTLENCHYIELSKNISKGSD